LYIFVLIYFLSSHSSSSDYPGRFDPEEDAKLPPISHQTNVFIRRLVQAQYFTVSQALQMHRESQHPTMFNNPNAKVRLRLELNMSSEKKVLIWFFFILPTLFSGSSDC
jgi:hypothetical protein